MKVSWCDDDDDDAPRWAGCQQPLGHKHGPGCQPGWIHEANLTGNLLCRESLAYQQPVVLLSQS